MSPVRQACRLLEVVPSHLGWVCCAVWIGVQILYVLYVATSATLAGIRFHYVKY
jgi:hypothetical protein